MKAKFKMFVSRFKKWFYDFIDVTPTEWGNLRSLCLRLSAAAAAAWVGAVSLPGIHLDGWEKAFGGFIAAMTFIAAIAQNKRE